VCHGTAFVRKVGCEGQRNVDFGLYIAAVLARWKLRGRLSWRKGRDIAGRIVHEITEACSSARSLSGLLSLSRSAASSLAGRQRIRWPLRSVQASGVSMCWMSRRSVSTTGQWSLLAALETCAISQHRARVNMMKKLSVALTIVIDLAPRRTPRAHCCSGTPDRSSIPVLTGAYWQRSGCNANERRKP